MKFKEYEKEYESVFSSEATAKKCDLTKVAFDGELSFEEYISTLKNTLSEYQRSEFDYLVKLEWLMRKFTYDGVQKRAHGPTSHYVDSAFGVFMRHHIGYSNKTIRKNTVGA